MRSKNHSNWIALLCLIGTVWTVVATSSSTGSFYGTYHIKSDCVAPSVDTTIVVSGNEVVSPADASFATFGLPTSTLPDGGTSAGLYNGVQRVCNRSLSVGTLDDTFIYTCLDNGQFACNIYFESQ